MLKMASNLSNRRQNVLERKRRSVITSYIKQLDDLLPKENEKHYESVLPVLKNSVLGVLEASTVYIKELKKDVEIIPKLKEKQIRLDGQARTFARRIRELEYMFERRALHVPPSTELTEEEISCSLQNNSIFPNLPSPRSSERRLLEENYDTNDGDDGLVQSSSALMSAQDPLLSWSSSHFMSK